MRNRNKTRWYVPLCAATLCGALTLTGATADEFTQADLERWKTQYNIVVAKGENLFHGGLNNKNTVSCDQCHPNASNTHPETYPKFQQQLGRVAELWEMINWCIMNPLESQPLAADDAKMIALQAYIKQERRGVKLDPGRH
jgi:cytochrome c